MGGPIAEGTEKRGYPFAMAMGGVFHDLLVASLLPDRGVLVVGDAHALRSLIGTCPITHCALHSTALTRHIP
jgi:hypothetical protein